VPGRVLTAEEIVFIASLSESLCARRKAQLLAYDRDHSGSTVRSTLLYWFIVLLNILSYPTQWPN